MSEAVKPPEDAAKRELTPETRPVTREEAIEMAYRWGGHGAIIWSHWNECAELDGGHAICALMDTAEVQKCVALATVLPSEEEKYPKIQVNVRAAGVTEVIEILQGAQVQLHRDTHVTVNAERALVIDRSTLPTVALRIIEAFQ